MLFHILIRIQSECGKKASVFGVIPYSGPYSVRMRKNTDQNNSEYGHFLCSKMFHINDSDFLKRSCPASDPVSPLHMKIILIEDYSIPRDVSWIENYKLD